jgi:hypothetical protein
VDWLLTLCASAIDCWTKTSSSFCHDDIRKIQQNPKAASRQIGFFKQMSVGSPILDSYQHTNALALVCFSTLLVRFEGSARRPDLSSAPQRNVVGPIRRVALPRLVPVAEMPLATALLVHELNGFGEDSDFALVASMYRHFSYWPTYLALIRTLLASLHESGELMSLVAEARILGWEYGRDLASDIPLTSPPQEVEPVLTAVRRFVRHPIARMQESVRSFVERWMSPKASPSGLNGLGSSGGGSAA